jgi:hypothetical protein
MPHPDPRPGLEIPVSKVTPVNNEDHEGFNLLTRSSHLRLLGWPKQPPPPPPPPPPDRGSTNLSRLAREALRVALICRTCPCHNGAPAFVDKNYRTQLLCRVWHSTKKPGWTVHSTKSLLSAPEIGGTLCWITWISFLHSFFIFQVTCSSNLNYLRKFNRTNKI